MALTLTDYIKQAATACLNGTGTFEHETREQATLEANSCPLPLVLLFDFTVNQKTTSDRVYRADVTMYFGTSKPGAGDDNEVENATVATMVALKRQFLAALDRNPTAEITNIRTTPFHSAFEAMLTGIGLQFTLGVPAASLLEQCLPALLGPMPPDAGGAQTLAVVPAASVDTPTAMDIPIGSLLGLPTQAGAVLYDATRSPNNQGLYGIAITGGRAGDMIRVQTEGVISIPGWGLLAGHDYFAGPGGRLVLADTGLCFSQIIGRAITADSFLYSPQDIVVLLPS